MGDMCPRDGTAPASAALVVRYRGAPAVEFVGDPEHFGPLARTLQSTTWKQQAIRAFTRIRCQLARMSRRQSVAARGREATALDESRRQIARIDHACGAPTLMIVHPRAAARAHRRYITAVDVAGAPLVFIKQSSDDRDLSIFADERETLQRLPDCVGPFRLPRYLGQPGELDRPSLMLECLPLERRDATWEEIRRGLLQWERSPRSAVLAETSWWSKLRELDLPEGLGEKMGDLSNTVAEVGLCHGDIRTSNVVICGDTPWLLDWEHSASDAPWLTDLLAWEINQVAVPSSTEPDRGAMPTLWSRPRDSLLALLYLAAMGNQKAVDLLGTSGEHLFRTGWGHG